VYTVQTKAAMKTIFVSLPRSRQKPNSAISPPEQWSSLRFRNRIELERLLSMFADCLRTVLAVKGSLRRARNGAPLDSSPSSASNYIRTSSSGRSNTITHARIRG
jgi:hypothetical protein